MHRLDPSDRVEERWLKQNSCPWSGSQEESTNSNTTRCDVMRAGYFSQMLFSTMMTIRSILNWLTVFIDLIIYLIITNGSWIVWNAFSVSVKMTDFFFPSLYTVSSNWSWVLVRYWNPGINLAQPFANPGINLAQPLQMFLNLVCWYCVEGVGIGIHDRYGSVAFWWCQVWLW